MNPKTEVIGQRGEDKDERNDEYQGVGGGAETSLGTYILIRGANISTYSQGSINVRLAFIVNCLDKTVIELCLVNLGFGHSLAATDKKNKTKQHGK